MSWMLCGIHRRWEQHGGSREGCHKCSAAETGDETGGLHLGEQKERRSAGSLPSFLAGR